jgi:hypothetical protein
VAALVGQGNALVVGEAALHAVKQRVGLVEFRVQVVDVAFAHLAGAQVEAPAVVVRLQAHVGEHVCQLALALAGRGHGVGGAAAVHDHPVAVFPAVGDVQDVAGLALEPAHACGVGVRVARRDPEARRHVAVEGQHAQAVLAQHVHVVKERQVVKDHVVLREADIVRQTRPRQIDGGLVEQLAAGVGDAVGHVGGSSP